METCPPEILQRIFALACTDAGYTGRSLSLVSRYIHDISSPFKYQSLAITQREKIITFSQTFSQLTECQKKIKYLFVHCPYPEDMEQNPELGDGPAMLSSMLLEVVRTPVDGLQPPEDNILEAFRAILNESSSTLTILGVYWSSCRHLRMHELIPPLPFLQELHLFRRSNNIDAGYGESSTKLTLFPRLRFLYISGDHPLGQFPFNDDLPITAPNLTHIRICPDYLLVGYKPQDSAHPFNLHLGGIIVENLYGDWSLNHLKSMIRDQFGTSIQSAYPDIEEKATVWQCWWASRVVGEVGPWGPIALSNSRVEHLTF